MKSLLPALLLLFFGLPGECLPDDPERTFDELFTFGRRAYTDERWYECVAFLKRAMEDFEYFTNVWYYCRKRCDIQVPMKIPNAQANLPSEMLEFRIFSRISQRALCVARCRQDRFGMRPDKEVDPDVVWAFQSYQQYTYMQYCYWKLNDMEHAVSSAYTYLSHNPNDSMMIENLNYYAKQKGFSPKYLRDLQEKEHQKFYIDGVSAYESEDFNSAVGFLEDTLNSYFEAEQRCRYLCDGPNSRPPSIGHNDFSIFVAQEYWSTLRCRQNCSHYLSFIRGNHLPDFIPSLFNYLQFAYYKTNKIRKACEAVGTFLLFYPDDESMRHNKKFYSENYKTADADFKPRPEIVDYYRRLILERRLLVFFEEKFKIENDDYAPEHPDDFKPIDEYIADISFLTENLAVEAEKDAAESAEVRLAKLEPPLRKGYKGDIGSADEIPRFKDNHVLPPDWEPSEETMQLFKQKGFEITLKESDLNGSFRFVAKNVLKPAECQKLFNLSQAFGELGSGYNGQPSPHTDHEDFRGLTAGNAAKLVAEGRVPLSIGKMYLDKSELARDLVEKYFDLNTHLFIDYTHLVCRTAIGNEDSSSRTDLSHPVHGDNCLLDPENGECVKRAPAFTWRDYSAIVFLNDDFDGGEFIFTDAKLKVEAEIKPQCGEMVGFMGDIPHGVKAVRRGTRCVLALWMTLDPLHQEQDRIHAQQLLAQLEMTRPAEKAEKTEKNQSSDEKKSSKNDKDASQGYDDEL